MTKIVKLTKAGAAARVLSGCEGMTFPVDSETMRANGRETIMHVRDYRFPRQDLGREFQVWSLSPEHYELLTA